MADFTRRISSVNFVVKGRTVEQLGVGGDIYVRLSPDEQQATGKLWRWECHCPYGGCDLWAQIQAGLRQCGWFAGGGAEVSNGEPVHRYSFLISPQRNKSAPAMALLDAHLRSDGFDDSPCTRR